MPPLNAIRSAGFSNKLEEYGFNISARAVGNFRSEQARDAALNIINSSKKPEAIFVANDAMALIVMDVLRFEYGLKIPDDIGIVGYDNVPPSVSKLRSDYSFSTYRANGSTNSFPFSCAI